MLMGFEPRSEMLVAPCISLSCVQYLNCPQWEAATVETMVAVFQIWRAHDRGQRWGDHMADVWQNGFPKRQGFYNCLIDGELEMRLKFYVCQVSMKPHWIDNNGDYVETMGRVQWKGEPIR